MLSVGLDLHKRYSQLEVLDDTGMRRASARLPNELEQVAGFFRSLGEPCRVVLEAGWNWGSMYDWLEGVENVVEEQLAHPYGVRPIAAAHVKTDRLVSLPFAAGSSITITTANPSPRRQILSLPSEQPHWNPQLVQRNLTVDQASSSTPQLYRAGILGSALSFGISRSACCPVLRAKKGVYRLVIRLLR